MTKKAIERALIEKLGCKSVNITHGSGDSVLNECNAYKTDKGNFFIKHNKSNALDMYKAEAFALKLLSETNTIRVPEVIYCGLVENTSFLVLEYIDLYSHTKKSQQKLGCQLATLHSSPRKKNFGFDINNTIGTTPQINDWSNDWTSFFCDQRLSYLLDIILNNLI